MEAVLTRQMVAWLLRPAANGVDVIFGDCDALKCFPKVYEGLLTTRRKNTIFIRDKMSPLTSRIFSASIVDTW
jgi:hypothetical protein